jgi:hypothetical protein
MRLSCQARDQAARILTILAVKPGLQVSHPLAAHQLEPLSWSLVAPACLLFSVRYIPTFLL